MTLASDADGCAGFGRPVRMADPGRLRREYLEKDEGDRSTLSDARAGRHQAPEQGFTFRGHRLSSLYRVVDQSAFRLTERETIPASSFRKYSNPTPQPGAAP